MKKILLLSLGLLVGSGLVFAAAFGGGVAGDVERERPEEDSEEEEGSSGVGGASDGRDFKSVKEEINAFQKSIRSSVSQMKDLDDTRTGSDFEIPLTKAAFEYDMQKSVVERMTSIYNLIQKDVQNIATRLSVLSESDSSEIQKFLEKFQQSASDYLGDAVRRLRFLRRDYIKKMAGNRQTFEVARRILPTLTEQEWQEGVREAQAEIDMSDEYNTYS